MLCDENVIVGRKIIIIEWCRLCCKEKVGFFYMINIVYIYDNMCYMFYLCC